MLVALILIAILAAAFGWFLAYEETNSLGWAICGALAAMPLGVLFAILIGLFIVRPAGV